MRSTISAWRRFEDRQKGAKETKESPSPQKNKTKPRAVTECINILDSSKGSFVAEHIVVFVLLAEFDETARRVVRLVTAVGEFLSIARVGCSNSRLEILCMD